MIFCGPGLPKLNTDGLIAGLGIPTRFNPLLINLSRLLRTVFIVGLVPNRPRKPGWLAPLPTGVLKVNVKLDPGQSDMTVATLRNSLAAKVIFVGFAVQATKLILKLSLAGGQGIAPPDGPGEF